VLVKVVGAEEGAAEEAGRLALLHPSLLQVGRNFHSQVLLLLLLLPPLNHRGRRDTHL
jgi:hypothetical protein